jgi:hypothetical protein
MDEFEKLIFRDAVMGGLDQEALDNWAQRLDLDVPA